MAEEWGSIIIKAPTNIRKAFTEHRDDLPVAIKELIEYTGADISRVDLALLHADSVTNKSGFIKLDYDCSVWVGFSAAILDSAENISYYGRHGDEYGTNSYFSLSPKGRKISVVHDLEENEDDEDTLIELGRWISSLPKAVTTTFADFNPLEESDYIKQQVTKKKTKPKPQVNLYCHFTDSVSEEEIRRKISPEYHDFSRSQPSNDGLADLLFSALLGQEDKPGEPDLAVFQWFPICEDRSKSAKDLLSELRKITDGPIYAHNFFGESSHPYRILRSDKYGTEEIFNTDDYTEADLDLLSEFEDPEFGRKINWFVAEFDFIVQAHEKYDLNQYASENVARLRKEADNALQMKAETHSKIWAQHSGDVVPILNKVKFYYYYRKLDSTVAEASAARLQQKGMWKVAVERGLGYSGRNSICVQAQQQNVADWLKENIDELSGHRIVIDDDLDSGAIAINMQ